MPMHHNLNFVMESGQSGGEMTYGIPRTLSSDRPLDDRVRAPIQPQLAPTFAECSSGTRAHYPGHSGIPATQHSSRQLGECVTAPITPATVQYADCASATGEDYSGRDAVDCGHAQQCPATPDGAIGTTLNHIYNQLSPSLVGSGNSGCEQHANESQSMAPWPGLSMWSTATNREFIGQEAERKAEIQHHVPGEYEPGLRKQRAYEEGTPSYNRTKSARHGAGVAEEADRGGAVPCGYARDFTAGLTNQTGHQLSCKVDYTGHCTAPLTKEACDDAQQRSASSNGGIGTTLSDIYNELSSMLIASVNSESGQHANESQSMTPWPGLSMWSTARNREFFGQEAEIEHHVPGEYEPGLRNEGGYDESVPPCNQMESTRQDARVCEEASRGGAVACGYVRDFTMGITYQTGHQRGSHVDYTGHSAFPLTQEACEDARQCPASSNGGIGTTLNEIYNELSSLLIASVNSECGQHAKESQSMTTWSGLSTWSTAAYREFIGQKAERKAEIEHQVSGQYEPGLRNDGAYDEGRPPCNRTETSRQVAGAGEEAGGGSAVACANAPDFTAGVTNQTGHRHDSHAGVSEGRHGYHVAGYEGVLTRQLARGDHFDGSLYRCTICTYKTTRKGCLTKHVHIVHHLRIPLLRCRYCRYTTRRRYSLATHTETMHQPDGPVHRSTECRFTTRWRDDLVKHARAKHNDADRSANQCAECKFTTRSRDSLVKHARANHNNVDHPVYRCAECNFTGKQKEQLAWHVNIHHQKQ